MLFIAEIFKNLLVVKIQTIFFSRIEKWCYAELLSLSWNYDFFSWKKKLVPLWGIYFLYFFLSRVHSCSIRRGPYFQPPFSSWTIISPECTQPYSPLSGFSSRRQHLWPSRIKWRVPASITSLIHWSLQFPTGTWVWMTYHPSWYVLKTRSKSMFQWSWVMQVRNVGLVITSL